MDSNITSLPPDVPQMDAVVRPRAALPGEAHEPHGPASVSGVGAGAVHGEPSADQAAATATRPRRRGRTALLAGAAVLTLAGASGAFLLSPYNHVLPVDTARLGAQARQLAASAGGPLPPVVAPAAKLATAPRPEAGPVYRGGIPSSTPDEQVAEILGFRSGGAARPTGTAGIAGAAAVAEVGAAPAPAPPPFAPPPSPVTPPPPAVQATATAGPASTPLPVPPVPPPASEIGLASQPTTPAPAPAEPPTPPVVADAAAAPPRPAPAPATPRPPAPAAPTDPAAVAIELRPAPMARGEQIEVLNLVAQLGVVVRDLRTENAALRAGVRASMEKVDGAVADFERRLALAEARGAINAAMGADPGAMQAGTTAPPANPPSPPIVRTTHPSGTPAPQPVGLQVQASPAQAPGVSAPAGSGARRYKVQAASPGLAMLSELDRSGGEGSQLQVGVGDQVPGYGRITAIQQQGAAWVVKTDRGTIQ